MKEMKANNAPYIVNYVGHNAQKHKKNFVKYRENANKKRKLTM